MLQDFYLLELYFGVPHAALTVDELVEKYGHSEVASNIREGYIQVRRGGCSAGIMGLSALCWLSDAGRVIVQKMAEL